MGSKFFVHLRRQWMGALTLFLVIAGGTAYAANTVGSTDIINGQVKTPDLAGAAVTTAKIATAGVTASDLAPDSVSGNKVVGNSLSGTDVYESTLAKVPAAIGADKLDGKDASQLGSARLHYIGEEQSTPLPGLHVASFCSGILERACESISSSREPERPTR